MFVLFPLKKKRRQRSTCRSFVRIVTVSTIEFERTLFHLDFFRSKEPNDSLSRSVDLWRFDHFEFERWHSSSSIRFRLCSSSPYSIRSSSTFGSLNKWPFLWKNVTHRRSRSSFSVTSPFRQHRPIANLTANKSMFYFPWHIVSIGMISLTRSKNDHRSPSLEYTLFVPFSFVGIETHDYIIETNTYP